jgi:ATP-dependent Lon protease
VDVTVGQDRALEALRLGLEVRAPGYNIFVCGLHGTGRTTTVMQMVRELAPSCPVPRDRAFVHRFSDPQRPRLLTLAAGRASVLRKDMEQLVELLHKLLPDLMEDREFHRRRDEILRSFSAREEALFADFRKEIGSEGFALVEIAGENLKRLEILPLFGSEPVPMDQFRQLVNEGKVPKKELEIKEAQYLEARRELAQVLRKTRALAREMGEAVHSVLKDAVMGTFTGAFEDMRSRYEEEAVRAFLDEVEHDVLENIIPLAREAAGMDSSTLHQMLQGHGAITDGGRFRLYTVNVIVDRRSLTGCPIVNVTAPSVTGIFGTIERRPVAAGIWVADHGMIRGGDLLDADGGFLVLSVEDLLAEPQAAMTLRRVLKHRRLEIRAMDTPLGLPATGLSPEAIDLDVTVILVGDWRIHDMLYRMDPDFAETFRVKADFAPDMDSSTRNVRFFLRVARKIVGEADLRPIARDGLTVVAEYGVRTSGRQGKITTRFSEVGDVLREADFWAGDAGSRSIHGRHVRKALERRDERNRLAESRLQDLIERGVLMVETKGQCRGRVNGLSVYDLGYYSFGKPTVITAATGVGQAGIINVEREARLSGGIYDKGVLIIAGYLRRTFAQDRPLTLTASVCFEQSYSGVDGDSASVAEVAALLSELSGIPVEQGMAVTGSLNQHGEVQPIGGVNEKIEGFFQVCSARGLDGKQGVLIPAANVPDLMLSEAVVEACTKKKFHVWSVDRVEDAMELLLSHPAGSRGKDGQFIADSIYRRAEDQLRTYAARLQGKEDWKPVDGALASDKSTPSGPVGKRGGRKSR